MDVPERPKWQEDGDWGEDWGEDPETWLAGLEGKSPEVVHDGRESFIDALHPRNLIR